MQTFIHLTFEQLADLAAGMIEEHTLVTPIANDAPAHLADCAECAAQLARWRQTIELMRTDKAADAPASVVQRAVQLFQPQRAAAPALFKRVTALLQFDSATMEPAFGVRAAGNLVRQLLFSAGPYDVDIRLLPAGNGWQVAGQVLGAGQSGRVTLQAAADQAVIAQAELNDLLEFALAPVAAGQYEFVLRIEQIEVVIPAFILPMR